jgi:hypothetical protein
MVLLANAAGQINGVGTFDGAGNLIALSGGELDGSSFVYAALGTAGVNYFLGAELDDSGSLSLGWQQIVKHGGRLPPFDRESDTPAFGRSSRTFAGRAALPTHFGRTSRLPRRNRGARA